MMIQILQDWHVAEKSFYDHNKIMDESDGYEMTESLKQLKQITNFFLVFQ